MGIFIYLSISESVTKDEWASVYGETLRLVEAFPLAERMEVSIRGIKTICLVPTKEREERYGWHDEKVQTGWFADGDYESFCTAEAYFLPKNLVTDEEYDPDAPDAMFRVLPSYLDYDWKDSRFSRCYELWGAKTQGEPYHMYLLAIACLIESRLGSKAFVYGDITKGQCCMAVKMANLYLENKIDIPASCNPERFLARIKTFPFSELEILKIYVSLYLGNKDADFGSAARRQFSDDAFDNYWKERFGCYQVTMRGFNDVLHDYLLWGFDLERLAGYVSFYDKEGNSHYEDFVRRIMEAKLYLKDKDCKDILKIDPEDEQPYGIDTLFAQFVFGFAANRKVDRYIPLADIREALSVSVGDKCDVNRLIDEYLKEDEAFQELNNAEFGSLSEEDIEKAALHDASAVFTQAMELRRKAIEEKQEQFDISKIKQLPFYEPGDSIRPEIEEQVGRYFAFYRSILKEERYAELMQESPKERCEWIVFQNISILLRDKDWDKIFRNIMETPESFARYYPMVRVKITGESLIYLIRAIAINDDFYKYAFDLEAKFSDTGEEHQDE